MLRKVFYLLLLCRPCVINGRLSFFQLFSVISSLMRTIWGKHFNTQPAMRLSRRITATGRLRARGPRTCPRHGLCTMSRAAGPDRFLHTRAIDMNPIKSWTKNVKWMYWYWHQKTRSGDGATICSDGDRAQQFARLPNRWRRVFLVMCIAILHHNTHRHRIWCLLEYDWSYLFLRFD